MFGKSIQPGNISFVLPHNEVASSGLILFLCMNVNCMTHRSFSLLPCLNCLTEYLCMFVKPRQQP